jgi:hypothetical protein
MKVILMRGQIQHPGGAEGVLEAGQLPLRAIQKDWENRRVALAMLQEKEPVCLHSRHPDVLAGRA